MFDVSILLRVSLATCLSLLSASFGFSQRTNLVAPRKDVPVSFELNRGQVQPGIDFVARGDAYDVYVRAGHASLHVNRSKAANTASSATRENLEADMKLVGANETPELLPEGKIAGYSNFLYGSDPTKWITEVASYARMRYANVYPGIDLIYHGNQDRVENDFIVLPGADPRQITLGFSNARKLHIDKQGDLVLGVGNAEFALLKPRAYQVIAGKEVAVAAAYVLKDGQAHFHLGHYDVNSPLTIDPVLVYATFFGGAIGPSGTFQSVMGAAVDAAGNLYMVGVTGSTSFPVTPGAFSTTPADDFLAKFDPTGANLIFSTYFTGLSNFGDFSSISLAVDGSGNIFVGGRADPGLPIPASAHPFQPATEWLGLLKFNSTGTAILAGTYFGSGVGVGPFPDEFGGLAVDTAGSLYLTGSTTATTFPTQTPLQASLGASQANAFVSKIDPTLSTLSYSTYLGQASSASGSSITVDAAGNAYVIGSASTGFPTTSAAFQTSTPMGGAFLAKLDPTGTSLLYATYVSGSTASGGSAVALDASGNIFLAGQNVASDFPVLNPVQTCVITPPLLSSGFISELDSSGALVFSSCLGTDNLTQDTSATRVVVDSTGKIFVLGKTEGTVALMNPIDSVPKPNFVSEIDPASHSLVFSTYVAGPGVVCCDGSSDHATSIAVDSDDNIYVLGWTTPEDGVNLPDTFPVFNARQPLFVQECTNPVVGCSAEAFILKISPNSGAAAAVVPSQANFGISSGGSLPTTLPLTVIDLGTDPLTISSIVTSPGFTQTNNCGTVAAAGGSCTIQVTLAAGSGSSNGILTITDSSARSPHLVELLGPGNTAGTSSFSLAAIEASASVSAGAPATYNLAVAAGSAFSGVVQLECSGVPAGAGCSVSPKMLTLGQGQLGTAAVTVTTTAPTTAQSTIHRNEIASAGRHSSWIGVSSFAVFGVALLPIFLMREKSRGSNLLWSILLTALSVASFGCSSGGNGGDNGGGVSPPNGTPSGTYTIVLTGSSGGASQTARLTLVVK